jgi:AraC-like DNA-binding protein
LSDHLAHSDPIVHRFERWARARLTDGVSLDEAANAVGTSKRTLARRMQSVLGKSPLDFFQSLRIERAGHLLQTGTASFTLQAAEGAQREVSLELREIEKAYAAGETIRLRSFETAAETREIVDVIDSNDDVERGLDRIYHRRKIRRVVDNEAEHLVAVARADHGDRIRLLRDRNVGESMSGHQPCYQIHDGIDLYVPSGSKVQAVSKGSIVEIGFSTTYGQFDSSR